MKFNFTWKEFMNTISFVDIFICLSIEVKCVTSYYMYRHTLLNWLELINMLMVPIYKFTMYIV